MTVAEPRQRRRLLGRADSAPTDPGSSDLATWRSVAAGPVVAVVAVLLALLATRIAGVRFEDWEHAVVVRLAQMGGVVALLVMLDIVVRAARRSGKLRPSRAALRSVREERWPWRRVAAVAGALVGFYVTYLAYRNVKSAVPLLRPGELFDRQLAGYDRALFGGNDPAALLHSLLGTGSAAEILSLVYMAFFYFVLISLPLALVLSPRAQGGIFYVTALSLNWVLGAASYLLLPARGPIYAAPGDFAALPATDASHLQSVLLRQRDAFLQDPTAAHAHQGIGAFASLHTAIIFTAAVAAHILGLGRRVQIGLWILFALTTTATVYLGWHYVIDDLAGLVIGVVALALARALTGFQPGIAWRLRIPRRLGLARRAAAAQPVHHVAPARPVADTTSGSDAG